MNDTTKASVLIVEDDRSLNLALVETLNSYGYATTSAYHGLEALDKLRQSTPDVIVCDINMPVMDGHTFLQHTRANPELRLLPFIFLTAHSTTEDQRRAKSIGVEDYLSKPIDSKDLVVAIENALKRRRLIAIEVERSMERLRNRIVGLLQHEFRTPLTFILGYAELLSASNDSNLDVDELRTVAAGILEGGRRLQQLIENFLLMAELQTYATVRQEFSPSNAMSLWNDILSEMAPPDQLGRVAVRLNDQENERNVNVDVRLVDEALRRLCDYVLRVRRPDATAIECGVEYRVPYVGLTIRCDNVQLPPLPPAKPHEQPSSQSPADEIDADLGLVLARSVAHLHGGRLAIEHGPGAAIALTLWLPGVDPEAL